MKQDNLPARVLLMVHQQSQASPRNRVFNFLFRPWIIIPLDIALWGLIIWAALWIGGAV